MTDGHLRKSSHNHSNRYWDDETIIYKSRKYYLREASWKNLRGSKSGGEKRKRN